MAQVLELQLQCVSHQINLLSLYYGSLLNSFLLKAKDPHIVAHPWNSLETWDMTILLFRRGLVEAMDVRTIRMQEMIMAIEFLRSPWRELRVRRKEHQQTLARG